MLHWPVLIWQYNGFLASMHACVRRYICMILHTYITFFIIIIILFARIICVQYATTGSCCCIVRNGPGNCKFSVLYSTCRLYNTYLYTYLLQPLTIHCSGCVANEYWDNLRPPLLRLCVLSCHVLGNQGALFSLKLVIGSL